jgi:hypothetical protein
MERETGFDVGAFRKLVAEFDSRTAELEARNAALQERLDQREADGGKLADLLAQAEEKIAALENDEQETAERGGVGLPVWLRDTWFSPWEVTRRRLLLMGAGLFLLNLPLLGTLNGRVDAGLALVAMVVILIDVAFVVWLVTVALIRLFDFLRRWAAK